jgi:hypothetical protein
MEYVMNKKLIIIIISVVVIIAVVAILMISNSYPEDEEQIAAGSIGKVEKHHVANIQGYDIELRSDFISDDSQIKKLVRDLTYYYVTMNRLSFVLGSINYSDFCGKLPDNSGNICDKLMNLKEFVDNNREKLKTSIETFANAYDNDDPPTSDVENQMIQIADFHIQFMKRNDILNEVIRDLDRVIDNPQTSKNFNNINDVIQLRDLLLITNLDIASIVGDKDNYEFATDQELKNTDIIKDISSNNLKANPFLVYSNILQSVYSFGDMQNLMESQEGINSIFGGLISNDDVKKLFAPATEDGSQVKSIYSYQIGNSKLEIAAVNPNIELNTIRNLDKNNIILFVSGGLNDIKACSQIEGLSFLSPYGIFGITQNDLSVVMSQDDWNSFFNDGNLSVFANEDIIGAVWYGVGNLNSTLGTFLGFPDVLSARRNMDP